MRFILVALSSCLAVAVAGAAPAPEVKQELLIVSNRTGSPEIFRINADGTGVKNLTNSKSVNINPVWSPDRRKIAFVSNRDGVPNIYVMDHDGKNVKQLTKGREITRVPTWSADGKKIAFMRATARGTFIFVMDADGGNVKQLTNQDGYDPAWSPDGKKILFTSYRGGRGFRLYVMDADGGNVKELNGTDNRIGFVYPSWSPDSKKVAWTGLVNNTLEIFTADADGQNVTQITKLGGTNTYTAWSPDGKKIAFHHSDNANSGVYYVMDANGKNMKELVKNEPPIEGGRIVWRPKER
jgi:TolB protein